MKRFIVAAILVSALMALVAGTALAAGPTTPPGQGFGPGRFNDSANTPDTGVCPGMGAGGMARGGAPEWAGEQDAVAKLLDMTEDEIQAERQLGKSLAQIAAAKGVSEDTLIKTILRAKKDALAGLVKDGKLTEAQADAMIENMTDRVKTMVERTDVGPAFGRGGARGMMGQGMRGSRWNRS
jgi:hypothetical protein